MSPDDCGMVGSGMVGSGLYPDEWDSLHAGSRIYPGRCRVMDAERRLTNVGRGQPGENAG